MGERGVVALEHAGGLDRSLIGGKAASLVELAQLGLRVPPGFVVTTEVWRAHRSSGSLSESVERAVGDAVSRLEVQTGRRFGGGPDPLLLSVRSGAPASMPGMLDTLLDVGFGPGTHAALATSADEAFARGCHRRLLVGWATTVLGRTLPVDADPDEVATLVGGAIPGDPHQQLLEAVGAVLRSWDNVRAHAYREHHGIDHDLGTAVVVQAMVFGDRGTAGGAGVAFSRDPDTGAPGLCGDFLPGAPGADVVAGTHHPLPVSALADVSAAASAELEAAVYAIETASADMVDVEFVVEDGVLHLLQHRRGPRAAAAAVRIAVDLVDSGTITVDEAIRRVTPGQLALAARPAVASGAPGLLATGIGACPGAASGQVCLSPDHVAAHDGGVVLVRTETSPHDVHAMTGSTGLVTARGGLVSHAALVARELDLPAVVGVVALDVDEDAGTATFGRSVLHDGDVITIDGASGRVHAGIALVVPPAPAPHVERLRGWIAASDRPDHPASSPG